MVMASARWLGVRLDLLVPLLLGAVSLAAVLASQDAGRCICKVNQNLNLTVCLCEITNRHNFYVPLNESCGDT